MERTGDAVVGEIERERLSAVLTAIHRSGNGHNARVLDAERGDLVGQLRRAGVALDPAFHPAKDAVLVLIHAPGRTAQVADLLHRAGARRAQAVARTGASTPFASLPLPEPRVGRGRTGSAPSSTVE